VINSFVESVITRVVGSGNEYHSNVMWIKDDEGRILVEQVRNIYTFLGKTSYNQSPRFIVIDVADSMNIQSCNALLKILEDCSVNAYFLLLCHNVNSILRTVRSRCIAVRVPRSSLASEDFDSEFHGDVLNVIENLNSDITVLYSFLDRYFLKESAENKWQSFVESINQFMQDILNGSGPLALSRSTLEWVSVFSKITKLIEKTAAANLSYYNVALLSFFYMRIRSNGR